VLADEIFEEAQDAEANVPADGATDAAAANEAVDAQLGAAASVPYVVYDVWDPGIQKTSLAPIINRLLADAVRRACRVIFDAAAQNPALMGMGTTTTALCLHQNWAYVAHVGDSRCYMQRDGALMQVTDDHSLVNEQIKAGLLTPEAARVSRHKNIITRSVGFEPDVEVDCFMMPVRPGDQFLLCSDGLSNLIEDEELAESMVQLRGQSLVDFLVELALGRGGDDNITVITVDVLDEPLADAA
jgi:protein phosphatase